jgi:hypothetical protein
MPRKIERLGVSVAMLAFGLLGCSTDERLVKQAEKASDRQAEQNHEIARQNQELAEATNQLVTADAQSRQETLALQRELQNEQARLAQKRDDLETERRQIASQRQRDPIVGALLIEIGTIVACMLPLVLCGLLFHGLRHEPNAQDLADLLTTELVSECPVLLPPLAPRALPTHTPPRADEADTP